MKKTLKLWMLQLIVLSIVSCTTDIADNPVVYTPFEQVLMETELFTDISQLTEPDEKHKDMVTDVKATLK